MKCSEAEAAIEVFMKAFPSLDHEWDNIAASDTAEEYICRGCLARKTVPITRPGGE